MKTIITVIGKDQPGIVAAISSELYKCAVNILDISQTIMNGHFTMIMVVSVNNAIMSFEEVKNALIARGEEVNVKVNMQREEIFEAMRSV